MSKPVILCVDDELMVLDSLKIQLKKIFKDSYIYEFAESAAEALEVIAELATERVKILVIVSDWLMPGIKGDEFLIKVHKQFPRIVKIMLTGQADDTAVQRAVACADLFRCLRKPWTEQELVETIEAALQQA